MVRKFKNWGFAKKKSVFVQYSGFNLNIRAKNLSFLSKIEGIFKLHNFGAKIQIQLWYDFSQNLHLGHSGQPLNLNFCAKIFIFWTKSWILPQCERCEPKNSAKIQKVYNYSYDFWREYSKIRILLQNSAFDQCGFNLNFRAKNLPLSSNQNWKNFQNA